MEKAEPKSLIERINTEKADIIVANRCNPKFGKSPISKEEENKRIETILKDFFKEDLLSYEVALSKKSYAKMTEPIIKKYSSLLNILFVKRDDEFDKEAIKPLQSMTNVGYVMPDLTTKGMIEHRKRLIKHSLSFGAGLTVVMSIFAGGLYAITPELQGISLIEGAKYVAMGFPASTGLYYSFSSLMEIPSMKVDINNMKREAKKADEYLREQYKQYVK
ncbi:hypothetical protein AUJ83_03960 [Candidatus Woesearchaeota archaeon CG1_02_33_12]|nr:MAG: hypothetical protein AUJ83_03960 [Candidatus Woesearchaeota archaeon CG1_02_33_12]PIN79103.1 MAG: hypothetical protein COV14_00875 [Candidatus Woesearchaeota archaeon CG10_big_fil_rev_8_21_14_0_10_33_12]PIU72424.1 MAG: hypothetical protein COS79_02970 [Candidatus Woesearchaeota archaeon CG06_land_8_20_14_3_00_33_13]